MSLISQKRVLCAAAVAALMLGVGPAMAQSQPPLKIGFPGAHKVFIGSQLLKGAQLATSMINEKGGVLGGRKIELVVYDTGFSPAEGVSAVQRLINENGVKLVTGELSSTVAYAEIPVIRAAGGLFMPSLPKHPGITKTGYDRIFRVNSTTQMDIDAFKPILLERFQDKSVALITENSEAWIDSRRLLRETFSRPGQVVFDDLYELQQGDYTALVTNAKRSGAQVLCITGTTPEHYANIIRAAGEIGYRPQICLVPGILFPGAVDIAGDAINGAVSADVYVPNLDNPANKEFVAAYQKAHRSKPDKGVALGFESVWIIAHAADKAKSDDPGAVSKVIRETTWQVPRGEVRYGEDGQASTRHYIMTVKNGRIEQWE
jgi:branched-chain amino acid transport system substrate-binding protein